MLLHMREAFDGLAVAARGVQVNGTRWCKTFWRGALRLQRISRSTPDS
jgi:hypothetical protein